jgi:hypothetical protein
MSQFETSLCRISVPLGCWKFRPSDFLLRLTWGHQLSMLEEVVDGLTPRKYADSPGPFWEESALYGAYGGPQARVSSPLMGCSILMTSALGSL